MIAASLATATMIDSGGNSFHDADETLPAGSPAKKQRQDRQEAHDEAALEALLTRACAKAMQTQAKHIDKGFEDIAAQHHHPQERGKLDVQRTT